MSSERTIESVMREWLASGDEHKVRVARARLLMLETGVPPPQPAPPPARRRTMADVRSELVRTNALYCRECPTGCQQSRCLAGLGDAYGRAPLDHCVRCLTAPAGCR